MQNAKLDADRKLAGANQNYDSLKQEFHKKNSELNRVNTELNNERKLKKKLQE